MNRREHISEYVSRIAEVVGGSQMWPPLIVAVLLAGVTLVGWLILGAES
jgi:hypothetical protein